MSTKYTNRGRRLRRDLESLESNLERRIVSNEISNNEFYLFSRKLESIKRFVREIRKNYETDVNRAIRNIPSEDRRAVSSIINGAKKIKIGDMDESLSRLKGNQNTSMSALSREVRQFANEAGSILRTEFSS